MSTYELNMDGIVGPTHHYGGLALGNLASDRYALSPSRPKEAALQGLEKMKLLHNMGIPQAVLPPHERPNLKLLHQLGFTGKPEAQIQSAMKKAPELLSISYAASSMWTANAATVTASADSQDKCVHFTPANLVSHLHRQQESLFTHTLLRTLFHDKKYFHHHPPLPFAETTSDEGAANHNRLCENHGKSGINLFVFGKSGTHHYLNVPRPQKYPARQSLEASRIIARNHQLGSDQVVFALQNPAAIDAGVFHNDVIAVGNESVLLLHEEAFSDQMQVLAELKRKSPFPLTFITIPKTRLCLAEVVSSYLFNSQLLTLSDGSMTLISPRECEINPQIRMLIEEIIDEDDNPIKSVHYTDLKQSMQNGGGPACLRLRVPLASNELTAMHQGVILNDSLLKRLQAWVVKHYRDELHLKDLADPMLVQESLTALDELSGLLNLGAIYPFQTGGPNALENSDGSVYLPDRF